jgi:hypothetical protein
MIELIYDCSTDDGMSGGTILDPETGCAIGVHQGTLEKGVSGRGRLFTAEQLKFLRAPPLKGKKFKQEN